MNCTRLKYGQTFIEKVVQNYAVGLPQGHIVRAGDYLMIRPKHVMTHDNTGPVISKFKQIGLSKVFNPRQPVFALDHDVQNFSETNQAKYLKIEEFARKHEIDFYPAGRGIGHQIMIEQGYAFPGTLMVGSDSHTNMLGGVGCVGTPIVRTDAAAIWATGQTWWQVPPIVKVNLNGKLREGVTGKDVIIALCAIFNQDQVLNTAIEFSGTGIKYLSIDDRLTIANMTTEWSALAGVFPVDNVTLDWYRLQIKKLSSFGSSYGFRESNKIDGKAGHPRINDSTISNMSTPIADTDAEYSATLDLDLDSLVPHVSGPNSVKVATRLPELVQQNVKINKAYLVSCTNSRASDLAAAAKILKGKKIADGVSLYVAAASSDVQKETENTGDWKTLIDAGATVLPAGCGPCIGLGVGLLEDGEIGISATNRNYKGRMGSPKALAYLASPIIVAESALRGFISGPINYESNAVPEFKRSIAKDSSTISDPKIEKKMSALLSGFPKKFSGEIIFTPQDNMSTDAIYPGKYTYQDDITPEGQAKVVMENYDINFVDVLNQIKPKRNNQQEDPSVTKSTGTILVAGFNFGTGSSREQAATSLLYAGIPVVIAGSFGDIFKRNAINNGLICVECPKMVEDLTEIFTPKSARGFGLKSGGLTAPTTWSAEIFVGEGILKVLVPGEKHQRIYPIQSVGSSVQDIWLSGGLESWVKKQAV